MTSSSFLYVSNLQGLHSSTCGLPSVTHIHVSTTCFPVNKGTESVFDYNRIPKICTQSRRPHRPSRLASSDFQIHTSESLASCSITTIQGHPWHNNGHTNQGPTEDALQTISFIPRNG